MPRILSHRPIASLRSALAATAAVVLGAMLGPAPAPAAEPVGFVRSAEGTGVVRRAGQEIAAREGLGLVEGDVVSTAPDGRLGVLFVDDTRVGIGAGSQVQIVRFSFRPMHDELAFVLRIGRGAVAYLSGKIAALAPGKVRIETPAGVVGVRGTAFAVQIEER